MAGAVAHGERVGCYVPRAAVARIVLSVAAIRAESQHVRLGRVRRAAYLTEHPMFLIPTPYPDTMGQEATPGVIDHNRDHLRLTHGGTRAIWQAVQTVQPQVLMDMHTGGVNTVDVEPGRFIGIDPDLRTLGDNGANSVRAYLATQGITTGPLPVNEWNPNTLRNVAGLAGMVTFLSETYGGNVMSVRLNADYHAAKGVLLWHAANSARISATRQVARERAVRQGVEAEAAYWIGDAHTEGTMFITPPPQSYTLPASRWGELAPHRAAFGIQGTVTGDTVTVDMGQASRPVIPMILDRASTEATVRGVRRSRPPHGEPVAWGPVRVEGKEFPVTSVDFIMGGQARRVWP